MRETFWPIRYGGRKKAGSEAQDQTKAFETAKQLIGEKKTKQAIDILMGILNGNIDNDFRVLVLNGIGAAYWEEKAYDRANQYFKKALKLAKRINETQDVLLKLRLNCLRSAGYAWIFHDKDFGKAIKALEAYLRLVPRGEGDESKISLRAVLGALYIDFGEYDKAIDIYNQAIALATDERTKAQLLSDLGYVFFAKKDYPEAKELYEEALLYDSENRFAFINLGELALAQDNAKEAYQYFQEARKLGSTLVRLDIGLASCCAILDKAKEASKYVRQVLLKDPDSGVRNLILRIKRPEDCRIFLQEILSFGRETQRELLKELETIEKDLDLIELALLQLKAQENQIIATKKKAKKPHFRKEKLRVIEESLEILHDRTRNHKELEERIRRVLKPLPETLREFFSRLEGIKKEASFVRVEQVLKEASEIFQAVFSRTREVEVIFEEKDSCFFWLEEGEILKPRLNLKATFTLTRDLTEKIIFRSIEVQRLLKDKNRLVEWLMSGEIQKIPAKIDFRPSFPQDYSGEMINLINREGFNLQTDIIRLHFLSKTKEQEVAFLREKALLWKGIGLSLAEEKLITLMREAVLSERVDREIHKSYQDLLPAALDKHLELEEVYNFFKGISENTQFLK